MAASPNVQLCHPIGARLSETFQFMTFGQRSGQPDKRGGAIAMLRAFVARRRKVRSGVRRPDGAVGGVLMLAARTSLMPVLREHAPLARHLDRVMKPVSSR
jgi:hypothetical protein